MIYKRNIRSIIEFCSTHVRMSVIIFTFLRDRRTDLLLLRQARRTHEGFIDQLRYLSNNFFANS